MNAPHTRQADVQDEVNARIYHAASVVRHYPSDALEKAEVSALLKYPGAC